jgi:outer membrane protein OmpA-like peptidoglycan-associated protein
MQPTILLSIFFIIFSLTIFQQTYAQDGAAWDHDKTAKLLCTVKDFKGKARVNETIIFEGMKYKAMMYTTDKNGFVYAYLPKGDTYKIKMLSIGDDLDNDEIEIPKGKGKITASLDIQFELPLSVTLNDILYATGSAVLEVKSFPTLNKLALIMERKPNLEIEIIGHTDNVGSDDTNQILSEKRAASVRNYLIKKGISAERIKSSGKGPSEPVADNDSEAERKKNRRTEIRITKE